MINKIKQFFKQKHSQKAWQLLINQDRRNFLLVFGLFIIITAAFFAVYKINNKAQAAWWNDTWQYRKSIGISNSGNSRSGFVIQLSIDTSTLISANKMSKTCNDLRFIGLNGSELPFYLSNCNSATSNVFVKLDVPSSGTTIYMYYGNPSAENKSDGATTFDISSEPVTTASVAYQNLIFGTPTLTTTNFENNVFPLNPAVSMLKYTGTNDATTGNHYAYYKTLQGTTEHYDNYVVQTGDYLTWLEYDYTTTSFGCGVEINFTDATVLRTAATDQDGMNPVLTTTKDDGYWYWRRVNLASYVGKTIDYVSVVSEGDTPSATWTCYFNNIKVQQYTSTITQGTTGSEEQTVSPIAYYSFDEDYGTTVHNQMEENGENGLTSYYKLDEGVDNGCVGGSNDICDEKGLNDGTNSSATWSTGYVGSALTTNGNSTYFQIPDKDGANDFDYNEDFTVSFWVKTTATTNTSIVEKWSGSAPYPFVFRAYNSNYLYFMRYDLTNTPNVTSQTVINDDSWHHIVGKKEGSYIYLYVDGVLQNSALDTTTTTTTNSSPVYIGSRGGSSNWWAGSVDELKFYNRALTEQEIIAQYNSIHGHMINMDPSTDWVEGARQNPQQRALGKALDFDGSNDYVTVGNSITGVQSISLWIKPTNTTQSILDLDGGTHYLSLSSGSITANGFSSPSYYVNGVSGQTVTANVWNHVVITTATSFTGSAINIGKVSSNYFSGQIDEVKIYRKVLTVEQIKKEYNRGAGAVMGAATHAGSGAAPKGFWKLDEGSGYSAFDSSGNNNTGILTNMDASSDWVAGKVGKALDFDGTNDYVITSLNSINPSTTAFTASAWVKLNSTSAQQIIIQQLDGTGTGRNFIGFDSSGCGDNKFYSYLGGSCTSTNSTYIDNVWYHVTVTWDLTTMKIYINGNLENSGTPTAESANGEIIIGIGKDLSSSPMNGLIDHVKIYDYVRTPEQIHYDMATGSPIAHFSFDEGYGTTVHNQMEKNGEHGLVSWWKFDDSTSGTSPAPQDSMGINNGTWGGGATYTNTAKLGNAANFTSSGYISLGDPVSLQPTNLSVSVWFKTSSIGDMRLVRKRTYGYILGMGASDLGASSGQVTFNIFDSASNQYKVTSTSTYNDGSWHHAVGTFDGNNVKLYIDGQLIGTVTAAVNIYYESDEITIGRDGGVSSRYFTGQMDELKIYNRALTEQEIIAQYNSIHGHMINMDPSTDWVEGAKQNPQQLPLGKALDFDGSNDYVVIPDHDGLDFSYNQDFSVSFWIKDNGPNDNQDTILRKWAGSGGYPYGFDYRSVTGSIAFARWDTTNGPSTGVGTIPINDGLWHHVVGVKNGSNMTIYIDTKTNASTTDTTTGTTTNSSSLCISAACNGANYYKGQIDEIKIYNYALTTNEIKTEYNRGAALVLGAGKNEADTAASSLVGWWKMDEGSGFSAFDSSGNNNTGVLTNMDASSDWVAGKVGKALDFDGSNDYISVANSSSINITGSQITVSAWVNFRTANSHDYILEKGQNGGNAQYYFWYAYQWGSCPGGTNNCLVSGYYDGSTYRDYMYNWTPLTNRWYHLAWAADGSNVRIYIDGVMISEQTQTGSLQSIAYPLFFGSSRNLINHMDGKIDHVKLFNRALTGAEVAWEYNQGAPIYHWDFNDGQGVIATNAQGKSVSTDGLVGFWNMDSTTINDMSGNGNNLTNSGSPTLATGIKGNAVDYASASNQYSYCTDANCGADLDYQGNGLTVSVWVMADSAASGYKFFVDKGYYTSSTVNGGYLLLESDTYGIGFCVRNSNGTANQGCAYQSGASISTTRFQHVVGVYDNSTVKIYVDGVLRNTTSYSSGIQNVDNYFTIGAGYSGTNHYWDGKIDHVKVWQRALTAAEVAIEYSYDEKYGYLTNMDASSDWVNGALPTTNRPMLGKALDFDGSDDYITIPDTNALDFGTNPFSVTGWFKTNRSGTFQVLVSKVHSGNNNGWDVRFDTTNTLNFTIDDGGNGGSGAQSTTLVNDNNWHHFAAVRADEINTYLYIDGKLEGTGSANNNDVSGTENLEIGSRYSTHAGSLWLGQIDEIKIYNYGLTANQVRLDYNNGAAGRY